MKGGVKWPRLAVLEGDFNVLIRVGPPRCFIMNTFVILLWHGSILRAMHQLFKLIKMMEQFVLLHQGEHKPAQRKHWMATLEVHE